MKCPICTNLIVWMNPVNQTGRYRCIRCDWRAAWVAEVQHDFPVVYEGSCERGHNACGSLSEPLPEYRMRQLC